MFNNINKIMATLVATSAVTFAAIKAKTRTAEDIEVKNEIIVVNDNDMKSMKKKNKDKKSKKTEKEWKSSESIVNSCITRLSQWKQFNNIPGLVVGVSLKGHNVWVYSDGFADIEKGVKCSDETVMRIASISKSMTASLLGKLMQENKVDIDLPIDKYLTKDQFPEKQWEGKKVDITVRQLAAHLGGIRHYKKEKSDNDREIYKEFYLQKHFDSVTESLKLFKDDPLVAKPGTKFVYTTFGWTLISAVMETQLGEPFEKSLVKFLRTELGLNNTYLDESELIIRNRSSYYLKSGPKGELINAPFVDLSYKWGGGGLISNIYDLLKFGNIMLYSFKGSSSDGKKGFFNKAIMDEMWSPVVNSRSDWDPKWAGYGIGWCAVKDGKSEFAYCAQPVFPNLFSHTGGAVGASSVLLVEPKHELVIAIITNLQEVNGVYKMGLDIAQEFTKQNITLKILDQKLSEIKTEIKKSNKKVEN